MSELLQQLIEVCAPERVSDKLADRICYTRDAGPSPGGTPGYIVRPKTPAEIAGILQVATSRVGEVLTESPFVPPVDRRRGFVPVD